MDDKEKAPAKERAQDQENPVASGFVFKRRLRLEGTAPCPQLTDTLQALEGMVEACWSGADGLLLRYDASRLHIDAILERLRQEGIKPGRGLVNRYRLSWYRFVDANAAYNAKRTDIHCCNKPPRKPASR